MNLAQPRGSCRVGQPRRRGRQRHGDQHRSGRWLDRQRPRADPEEVRRCASPDEATIATPEDAAAAYAKVRNCVGDAARPSDRRRGDRPCAVDGPWRMVGRLDRLAVLAPCHRDRGHSVALMLGARRLGSISSNVPPGCARASAATPDFDGSSGVPQRRPSRQVSLLSAKHSRLPAGDRATRGI